MALLQDRMVRSGNFLFRWRGYALLAFLPLVVWGVSQGEMATREWGPGVGTAVSGAGIALLLAGQTVRILTVGFVPRGTSGRNTAEGQVAERLNTTGLYSLTRNPLYLGNCAMYLGAVVYTQNLWLASVMILALWLYYERIIAAEEHFLQQRYGAVYTDWVARVPPFLPLIRNWQRPDMTFSLRSVIRREHASLFGAVLALYLLELGLHSLPAEAEPVDPAVHRAFAIAVAIELAIVFVKRRTGWLDVPGR